jgi:GT2 family glycosyltransferase
MFTSQCAAITNGTGFGGDTLSRTSGHPRPDKREGPAGSAGGRGREATVRERVSHPKPVPFVMAAHWLVRVEALTKIGLFNETLFPFYGQDDDWCNRARYHGYKIGVVPGARAVHDRAERPEPLDKTVFRNYYNGSLVRLCNVNRPLWLQSLWVLAFTLVKTVKYRSLLPFKYFRKILSQLHAVSEHRQKVAKMRVPSSGKK